MARAKKPAAKTLAEKINHLFTVVHPPGREYTHEQVATAIEESGGPTISATYLWQLRTGKRDNPTMRHLEALSGFFGVPPSYFFDEDTATRVDDQLELLVALRDDHVRQVAVLANGLSAETLETITTMLERARQLEGLT
jgi:transcriptional regulator with XRE-family HTH domain